MPKTVVILVVTWQLEVDLLLEEHSLAVERKDQTK